MTGDDILARDCARSLSAVTVLADFHRRLDESGPDYDQPTPKDLEFWDEMEAMDAYYEGVVFIDEWLEGKR